MLFLEHPTGKEAAGALWYSSERLELLDFVEDNRFL
jgi:hypothetical protein